MTQQGSAFTREFLLGDVGSLVWNRKMHNGFWSLNTPPISLPDPQGTANLFHSIFSWICCIEAKRRKRHLLPGPVLVYDVCFMMCNLTCCSVHKQLIMMYAESHLVSSSRRSSMTGSCIESSLSSQNQPSSLPLRMLSRNLSHHWFDAQIDTHNCPGSLERLGLHGLDIIDFLNNLIFDCPCIGHSRIVSSRVFVNDRAPSVTNSVLYGSPDLHNIPYKTGQRTMGRCYVYPRCWRMGREGYYFRWRRVGPSMLILYISSKMSGGPM